MAKHPKLLDSHIEFIGKQHMFFVATADVDGYVNLSPKGLDSLRILDDSTVLWLNYTGSGNESAAHVQRNKRMTIMMCSFDEKPLILRIYGEAREVLPGDDQWQACTEHLPGGTGARQYFFLDVELVQTSCGFGVPLYAFQGERETLTTWSESKGEQGVRDYINAKNAVSLNDKTINIGEHAT